MEVQIFRTMLIIFVVTINTTTHITAQNEWKTEPPRTVNAGNVNTVHRPNSEEGVEWKVPSTRGVAKTTIFQKQKQKISTTDISMIDTENVDHESGNNAKKMTAVTKSQAEFSTVPTMHSNYSHHQDKSILIGIILGLTATVSLLVVVGLCYYKKILCFKRNEKCDEEASSIPMINENNKIADESVGEDTDLNVEDEVDISSANTNSYRYASKYNDIQPTAGDENVKVLPTCI